MDPDPPVPAEAPASAPESGRFTSAALDARLEAARAAIEAARASPDILHALAEFGYDESRLSQGRDRYTAALSLHQQQKVEYGQQFAATDALNAAWEAANVAYMRYLKVARIALKGERGAWQKLDLTGNRKRTLSGWLDQSRQSSPIVRLRYLFNLTLIALVTLSLSPASVAARAGPQTPGAVRPGRVAGQLPTSSLLFIENAGQFAPGARFQVRGAMGGSLWLADDGLWLTVMERSDTGTGKQVDRENPVTPSPLHPLTPSPPHPLTLSPRHPVVASTSA